MYDALSRQGVTTQSTEMNLNRLIISVCLAGGLYLPALAQAPAESAPDNVPANAVEKIESESGGTVSIDIPDNILQELLKEEQHVQRKSRVDLKPGINKLAGFRIQVFGDGHNQHTLESRAKARGNAIVAKFPKYRGQVYSYSSSPNWYTRIGNFRTQAEASSALAELKRAFPQYSSEMRVVKSQIVVIK